MFMNDIRRGSISYRNILISSLNENFRPGAGSGNGMYSEFPHLFSKENIKNTYFISKEGKPVSQASVFPMFIHNGSSIIKIASIGSVSTLKNYTNNGFATSIIKKIIQDLTVKNFSLMFVSGELELYKRQSCVKTGNIMDFSMENNEISSGNNVNLRDAKYRSNNSNDYFSLYRKENIRHIRTPQLMNTLLNSLWFKRPGWHMELFDVNTGKLKAYAVILKRNNSEPLNVMEYAGNREALINIFNKAMDFFNINIIKWHVYNNDIEFFKIARKYKIYMENVFLDGTVRILNERSLFQDLSPWFMENLGYLPLLKKIGDNIFILKLKEKTIEVNGYGELTRLIFGGVENSLNIPLPFPDDLSYI